MTPDRCQIGNPPMFYSDGHPGHPPCPAPPTVRYRSDGMVPGHWNFRCAAHAEWLAAPGLIVEPLSAPAPAPAGPVTDDDLWQIPAEYRDTVARWLIGRAHALRPSFVLNEYQAALIREALVGAAVDVAEPGADDTTIGHANAVLARLSGRQA